MSDDVLVQLAATISARRAAAPTASYTRQLLDAGPAKCAKKLGEEAVETVYGRRRRERRTAKGGGSRSHLSSARPAGSRGVAIADVLAVLEGAQGVSGLKEKAERGKR